MNGAWDAYLTVEGVSGESQRKGHEGEIELISFDFGGANPSSIGIGKGGGTGTVNLSSFNFMKKTDAASAELFQHMCTGKHFPSAVLTMYKSAGDEALDYLLFEFEEVYVDNINWSGSEGGDGIPMESVSVSFGKVTMTYNEQNPDGTKAGSHVGSWDVRAGTA
jgi:type VI secretion system secreted protein Hcp